MIAPPINISSASTRASAPHNVIMYLRGIKIVRYDDVRRRAEHNMRAENERGAGAD